VLADPYDAVLLDLDGVLYRWPEPIPGASEAVAALRKAGKRIAFVTNNSSRTPAQVTERLAAVGVDAKLEEVVTSALATATFPRQAGVVFAWIFSAHQFGAATAAWAAGLVRTATGEYTAAWAAAGGLALLAAVAVLLIAVTPKRPVDAPAAA